jgi:uncharacterized membrane protein YccF (DUF307 family)
MPTLVICPFIRLTLVICPLTFIIATLVVHIVICTYPYANSKFSYMNAWAYGINEDQIAVCAVDESICFAGTTDGEYEGKSYSQKE